MSNFIEKYWWKRTHGVEVGTQVRFRDDNMHNIWWFGTVVDFNLRSITVNFPNTKKKDEGVFGTESVSGTLTFTRRNFKNFLRSTSVVWDRPTENQKIEVGDTVKLIPYNENFANGVVIDVLYDSLAKVIWNKPDGTQTTQIYFLQSLDKVKNNNLED